MEATCNVDGRLNTVCNDGLLTAFQLPDVRTVVATPGAKFSLGQPAALLHLPQDNGPNVLRTDRPLTRRAL